MTEPVAFQRAESVEEACALLAEHEDARIVSGGTALAIFFLVNAWLLWRAVEERRHRGSAA